MPDDFPSLAALSALMPYNPQVGAFQRVDTRTRAPVGSLAALEDRRDAPDMTPEWRNLPGALRAAGTSVGNYVWGTPQIPEAPDTPLSDAAGKRDIRIVPQVPSRSALDEGIDAITDLFSTARKPGEKLGSDTPFTQRVFSKGR